MLEVEGINAFYGQFHAVHDVSLTIGDGQLVALFGPNGHGKSTLLKAVCGLLESTSGSVKWNGNELVGLPSEKIVEMGVIYIAEDRHLFPEMSIMQNLRLGAYSRKARNKASQNLAFVMDLFPKLAKLRDKPAATLSGGEARMLAIGRGIMSNPNFLAVDEPSLGLAPNLRMEVFKKIDEIRRTGVAILLVEQSTHEVAEIAEYMYLMEDGRIVYEGCKEDALKNEKIRQVFLGIG
jgi:branched-chain amino acid transport system ATP-binding protein